MYYFEHGLTETKEQMQQLVAGILRAIGYKTRIVPRGPDRGKDQGSHSGGCA